MVTLDVELYMFAVMAVTGAALGCCADVYRAVRDALQPRGTAALLQDAVFATAAAVVLAAGLVLAAWGAFRLVVFVGGAAGVALYVTLASPTVYPAVLSGCLRLRRAASAIAARGAAAVGRLAAGVRHARAAAGAGVAQIRTAGHALRDAARVAVEALRGACGRWAARVEGRHAPVRARGRSPRGPRRSGGPRHRR